MVFIITKEDIQLEQLQVLESQLIFYFLNLTMYLESTDAARRVPHPSPTRPNAVTRASVLCLSFFFFFFPRIRADSASIRTEPGWFGQNRAVSAILGRISRRLKQAEIGLESSRNSRNSHLRHSNVFLAFFFLCFVNQGIVMCFLRIF